MEKRSSTVCSVHMNHSDSRFVWGCKTLFDFNWKSHKIIWMNTIFILNRSETLICFVFTIWIYCENMKTWKRWNGNGTDFQRASIKWQMYKMYGICLSKYGMKWMEHQTKEFTEFWLSESKRFNVSPSPSSNGVSISFSISMNCANMWIIAYTVYT